MKKLFNFKAGNDNVETDEVLNEETQNRAGIGKWIAIAGTALAAVTIGIVALVKNSGEEEEFNQPEEGTVIEVTDEDIADIVD